MEDERPQLRDPFASRLAEAMRVRGVDADRLRELMGKAVCTGSIYAWLRGERTVRHDNLRAISVALGVSVDYLLGLSADMEGPAPGHPDNTNHDAYRETLRWIDHRLAECQQEVQKRIRGLDRGGRVARRT